MHLQFFIRVSGVLHVFQADIMFDDILTTFYLVWASVQGVMWKLPYIDPFAMMCVVKYLNAKQTCV